MSDDPPDVGPLEGDDSPSPASPTTSPFGTRSRAPWSEAVHICGQSEVVPPPPCPACADDHDYTEELIHGTGGW